MENVNDIKNSKEYSDFREYQEFRKFKAEQWKSARSKAQFTDDAKIQPQDKEIEDAVLGALMLERDAYAIVCDLLRPESFYDPGNQKIYAAINKLGVMQQPIDMLTVTQQLRADGALDSGLERRLSESHRAFSAGDEDHGRSGAILELAYLVLKLRGEIFFDIDYGVIIVFAGEAAQDMSGFGGVRGGIGLQPERTEADDGVSAANNSDFKHTYHAAFPV